MEESVFVFVILESMYVPVDPPLDNVTAFPFSKIPLCSGYQISSGCCDSRVLEILDAFTF